MADYNEPVAFDMGISTLGRINFELWHCNSARRVKDLDTWHTSLLNIYLELIPFMKAEELIEHKALLHSCENQVLIYKNIKSRKLYDNFISWESKLRVLMDKKGLLMRKGEAAAGAMI